MGHNGFDVQVDGEGDVETGDFVTDFEGVADVVRLLDGETEGVGTSNSHMKALVVTNTVSSRAPNVN